MNLLERKQKLITTNDGKISKKKLLYDINGEAAKISALSSSKNDKYEYLTVEEILSSGPSQIIQQAKFTYSHIGKSLEKNPKDLSFQIFKPS